MNMEPIIKSRVYIQIIEQIKKQIKTGQFKPGSRLPSERELAQMLQVGRSSVREAITVLENVGLLEVRPGMGAYVRDFQNRSSIKAYFDTLAALWEIEPSQILQLLQVRKMLEPQAASLAADNAAPEDMHELRQTLLKMKEAAAKKEVGEETDLCFHHIIARSSGNIILLETINTLSDLMRKSLQQTRWMALANPDRVITIIKEHELIIKAIEDKDSPAAQDYMLRHLQGVELNFKRYLEKT